MPKYEDIEVPDAKVYSSKEIDDMIGKRCIIHNRIIKDGRYGLWCGGKDEEGRWCEGIIE